MSLTKINTGKFGFNKKKIELVLLTFILYQLIHCGDATNSENCNLLPESNAHYVEEETAAAIIQPGLEDQPSRKKFVLFLEKLKILVEEIIKANDEVMITGKMCLNLYEIYEKKKARNHIEKEKNVEFKVACAETVEFKPLNHLRLKTAEKALILLKRLKENIEVENVHMMKIEEIVLKIFETRDLLMDLIETGFKIFQELGESNQNHNRLFDEKLRKEFCNLANGSVEVENSRFHILNGTDYDILVVKAIEMCYNALQNIIQYYDEQQIPTNEEHNIFYDLLGVGKDVSDANFQVLNTTKIALKTLKELIKTEEELKTSFNKSFEKYLEALANLKDAIENNSKNISNDSMENKKTIEEMMKKAINETDKTLCEIIVMAYLKKGINPIKINETNEKLIENEVENLRENFKSITLAKELINEEVNDALKLIIAAVNEFYNITIVLLSVEEYAQNALKILKTIPKIQSALRKLFKKLDKVIDEVEVFEDNQIFKLLKVHDCEEEEITTAEAEKFTNTLKNLKKLNIELHSISSKIQILMDNLFE